MMASDNFLDSTLDEAICCELQLLGMQSLWDQLQIMRVQV